MPDLDASLLARFHRLPIGYSEGDYRGRRYGLTVRSSADGRRSWLFGEDLGGGPHVSGNLYRLRDRTLLKPCEMSPERVIDFILHFQVAPCVVAPAESRSEVSGHRTLLGEEVDEALPDPQFRRINEDSLKR